MTQKNKSRKLKNRLFRLPLFLSGFLLTDYSPKSNLTDEEKRNMVELAVTVAEKQEKIFGITHIGEPKISFVPDLENLLKNRSGTYKFWSDEIWVYYGKNKEGSMAHEMGHRYENQIRESLEVDGLPKKIYRLFFKSKGEKLVSEGIATYFKYMTLGKTMNKKLEHGNFDKYLKEDKNLEEIYQQVGYLVVEKILDRGVRKGIELLIKNSPTKKDLKNLPEYQQRILGMIEGRW